MEEEEEPTGSVPGPKPAQTTPSPVPPPVPVATHPNRGAFKPPTLARPITEPNRLAPVDAYYTQAPPRLRPLTEIKPVALNGSAAASAAAAALRPAVASLRPPPAIPSAALEKKKKRSISRRSRRPPVWKKLLWVKQGYPDNYTDTETFLKQLERNPRFRPYEFWSLVAESTVIVQHVCSVFIFISCFVGIVQGRISSGTIVTIGSVLTVLGWLLWDYWIGQEEKQKLANKLSKEGLQKQSLNGSARVFKLDDGSSVSSTGSSNEQDGRSRPPKGDLAEITETPKPKVKPKANPGLGLRLSTSNLELPNGQLDGKHDSGLGPFSPSMSRGILSPTSPQMLSPRVPPPRSMTMSTSRYSPQTHTRLKTFKSALLIYFALLGLSPILQSLTKSTSSDSIWALATWLIIINVFFFDYGGVSASPISASRANPTSAPAFTSNSGGAGSGSAAAFPASLSTNAALMASTVLASRLASTTDVFSLTLFSIQVFALFPVFRRHLRPMSREGHYLLTLALILASSGGWSIILTSPSHDWWGVAVRIIGGEIVGTWAALMVMGGLSWWLLTLQRYKNVVIGPWDPARPVIRARPRGMTDA